MLLNQNQIKSNHSNHNFLLSFQLVDSRRKAQAAQLPVICFQVLADYTFH